MKIEQIITNILSENTIKFDKLPLLKKIEKLCSNHPFQMYIVGGTVRDLLINKIDGRDFKPNDIDLVFLPKNKDITKDNFLEFLKDVSPEAERNFNRGFINSHIGDIDLSCARKDVYNANFKLKKCVITSELNDDWFRRDSNVNSIYITLVEFEKLLNCRAKDISNIIQININNSLTSFLNKEVFINDPDAFKKDASRKDRLDKIINLGFKNK